MTRGASGRIYANVNVNKMPDRAAALIAVAVWEGDEKEKRRIQDREGRLCNPYPRQPICHGPVRRVAFGVGLARQESGWQGRYRLAKRHTASAPTASHTQCPPLIHADATRRRRPEFH